MAIHLDRDHGRNNDHAPMILRMPPCHYMSRRYGRSVISGIIDLALTTLPTLHVSHSNLTLFALSPPAPPPWTHPPGRPPATPWPVHYLMNARIQACWRDLEVSVIFRSYCRLCRTPPTPPNTQPTTYTHDTESRTYTQMKTLAHTCAHSRFHSHARSNTHAYPRIFTLATKY